MIRIRTVAFAVAVGAALAFGGEAATASPRPCPLITIGSCPNQDRCVRACADRGGDAANARCDNGCCYCPLPLE